MRLLKILFASSIIVTACSAGGSRGVGNTGALGAGGGTAAASGGAPSSGGALSGTGGGTFFGTGGVTLSNTPDGSCSAEVASTENVTQQVTETVTEQVKEPVAIYIMMDQSGSMVGPKWTAATTAITSFVNDPNSAGIDVAFHVFPPNFPPLPSGCGNCNGSDCATPMYPVGPLPGAAAAITNDLAQRLPFGLGTPLEAGLRGSTQFCQSFMGSHPGEKCVVLFITDGAPSNCATGAALVQVATDALAAGVQTFAVGMDGADFLLMDQIGQAGGTDCTPSAPSYACNVTNPQDFLVALEGIRSTITVTKEVTRDVIVSKPVACEYTRPNPPSGQTFDPDKVNVQYTIVGGTPTKVLHTDSAATCGSQGGWYYDDNLNPTKVIVCPSTCTTIQSLTNINFELLFGCTTEEVPS